MKKQIIYISDNGREFTSEEECRKYEERRANKNRHLTIAGLKDYLEKKGDLYVSGSVIYKHEDRVNIRTCVTMNISDKFARFASPEQLNDDEKYVTITAKELINSLSNGTDDSDQCQYTLYFREHPDATMFHSILNNYNAEIWEFLQECNLPQTSNL